VAEYTLPAEIRRLIARALPSMQHVDVLLALAADPQVSTSAESLAPLLRVTDVEQLRRTMADLAASGLVMRTGTGPDSYRYTPDSPATQKAVTLLAVAYHERPVTLVRAIYDRPATAIQNFADAFRLRTGED
jgi:hypothetical protein